MKNIRYFTNGVDTVEWNEEACMHSGKCLVNLPGIIKNSEAESINVSGNQFETIVKQADFCPSKALKLKDNR